LIRDLARLANENFDLVIVGGGIYGATLAWEAASRGLSTALVEKHDFVAATSANSLKTIHGGFRYFQSLDLARVRASMVERKVLMSVAPHLVYPLPVLVPTYGHAMKGREALALALLANEALSFDRNQPVSRRIGTDPTREIPAGKTISSDEALAHFPGLKQEELTGAAIFYDAQAYNTERLALAFLQSAAERGAALANYVQAVGFLRTGGVVSGIQAQDCLSGQRFEVRARRVVNAAGPWAGELLGRKERFGRVKAINLVAQGTISDYALGLRGDNGYADSARRKETLLFASPWRGYTLLGTAYHPYTGEADGLRVSEAEVQNMLDSFRRAYPSGGWQREKITFWHAGLLPADDPAGEHLSTHARIIDHRAEGVEGLMSVVGVKYTTARAVARQALDQLLSGLGRAAGPSISHRVPLRGGDTGPWVDFERAAMRELSARGLSTTQAAGLVHNYGTDYPEVIDCLEAGADAGQELLKAQARYAVRREMAQRLEDVILRRTDLGAAGHPGDEALETAAQVMAAELGWDSDRRQKETDLVSERYRLARE